MKAKMMAIFFGVLWGFGGLTFGLALRYLGVALGQSIALGLCAAFGTLLPPILAGDSLFAQSIGRTDFPGGSYGQLIESIKKQLMMLPDNVKVLPGHGPETTIGDERNMNPFIQ